MKRKIIGVLCGIFLAATSLGCDQNECDKNETKCQDNKVYTCFSPHVFGHNRWRVLYQCDDYNATCTDVVSLGDEIAYTYVQSKCVHSEITCDTNIQQRCVEDGKVIVDCSIVGTPENMPLPVVVEHDTDSSPYCVEKSDGTAAFAFADGECTDGAVFCSENDQTLVCRNGVWKMRYYYTCVLE